MASTEELSVATASWRSTGSEAPAPSAPRRRLFRKYALLFIGLVGTALLVNSGFDFWFSYQENKAALVRVQREKAEAAAQRVEEFVDEIKSQIGWTTHAQWSAGPLDQRRQDYFRLLRQVPAITELTQLDAEGREQLTVSRLKMDVVGSNADMSQTPGFTEAKAHRVWFSPVYFRKQSEPYISLAMAREGRNAGVTIAEINLKLIYDVITALKIGQGGYTYVVDGRGKLLAHPDISLVLRDTDLSKLPQVAAALHPSPEAPAVTVANNIAGHSVLTAHAAIPQLGWLVFVEVPLQEAFAPLYGAAWRTAVLLLLGLVAAALAALVLARRMTGPIRAIAEGAERLGGGDLSGRIEVRTGDELEGLAQQFNQMAADLQKSYAELEQRVRDRTAELSAALGRQTATAEVLGIISSSPGRLEPVFEAVLANAIQICGGRFGLLALRDGDGFRGAAAHGVGADVFPLSRLHHPPPGTGLAVLEATKQTTQVADCATDPAYEPVRAASPAFAEMRTALHVAMLKEGELIGAIVIYRGEVRSFGDKEIELVENFAKQAVIAIENARLITETREALEQQTATAEVLGVINASPGDLAPVFEAMLEKATRLCEAAFAILWRFDGELARPEALYRVPPAWAEFWKDPKRPHPNSGPGLMMRSGGTEAIVDMMTQHGPYLAGEPMARAIVDLAGARSLVITPLRKDGAALGAITIYRQEVRPFSGKEIALLENFAAQAVIAMENARLITETREALEQQTATAEVLGVINSSPGDLAPVFDAMLDKATYLCEAAHGALFIQDGERFRAIPSRSTPEAFAEFLTREPIYFDLDPERSIMGRTLQQRSAVQVADLRESEPYRNKLPIALAAVETGRSRTLLSVPMFREDAAIGIFQLARQEVRPFTEKQIALVSNFAAQAVIAIENTRLISETREALEQQTATAEVLGVINSSPGDLAPVFDALLEKAMFLCNAAFGGLWTFEGEHYVATALRGVPTPYAEFLANAELASPGPGTAPYRFQHGERSVIQNIDLAAEEPYQTGEPNRRALVDLGGARTALQVPLCKDDAVLGVITIYRQEVRPFSDKQIALLQNFAAQAVIAMENARLITETREALEQQTATAEVLGVINASPGDLAPVFNAILEKAHTFCDAEQGVLVTYDGRHFQGAATHRLPESIAAVWREPFDPTPGSGQEQLLSGEPLVHIPDITAVGVQPPDNPHRRAILEAGFRTLLMVPLRKEGDLLGYITAIRRQVRPFTEKQIALLENFAAQAVIAMENARLITETREALEQQTATAEVLGVINSSPGDLAPVFDAILEKAHKLCGVAFGSLNLLDGEEVRAVAVRGLAQDFAERLRKGFRPAATHPTSELLNGARIVHWPDMAQVADPIGRASFELAGIRTVLWVPLRKDDRLLGHIAAGRQEVRPFSEKEIALIENFAAQAVIAMENARLITETREALEQQTATAEVLGVINSSPGDLAPVFDAMLDKATSLCGADFGGLFTYNGDRFTTAALYNVSEAYAEVLRQPMRPGPRTALGRVARGEPAAQLIDITSDEELLSEPMVRGAMEIAGFRAVLAVPLRKEGVLLGAFTVYRREVRAFSDKQIALLQNFAAQAVIAMENARLITETREALEQQTATAEVLGVINSSPGDLAPVFDALLEKATGLCGAAFGLLARFDGEAYHAAALHNVPPAFAESWREPRRPAPGLALYRLMHGADLIHVEDVIAEHPYQAGDPIRRALADLGGARTALWVALRKDRTLLGAFVLYRQEVRPFAPKQVELVRTFAEQAVIAIDNARLLNELRDRTRDLQESLEYQTATSDVLKVISRSDAELEPVLENLVETATRLCQADHGYVFRRHGDRHHLVASFGVDPEFREFMIANPFLPDRGTLSGRVALERQIVHIDDAATDPEYTWSEAQQRGNLRTGLGVPLLREDTLLGIIVLYRSRVERFSDKQIALAATFADQAVIAIENARLLGALRERTDELARSVEELKALSEVGQEVSSTLDLAAVLSTILNRSVALSGADAGAVFRYNDAQHAFRLAEAVGWDEALVNRVRELRIAEHETGMGEATRTRRPLQLADLAARPSYPLRDATLAAGFRSVLIVPLVGADRIFGAIVLERRAAGEFPEATVRLMQTLASQSVLAIQNARLFREIADKSEELRLASQHKSQFLANMSHELRTPLNAILGYTELLVDGIYGELPEKGAGVLERVQNNGKHLLALINDVLDLSKIEAGQLVLTLEEYALPDVVQSVVTATEGMASTKGLKMVADVQPALPMGRGDARRLQQVLLNLVGNAVKFTDEGEVAIGARAENGHFVLTVRDTGPGIAPEDHGKIFEEFQQVDSSNTRKKGGTGLGLAISKRMVEMQGGSISVESEIGHGATFRVSLPIRVEEIAEELMGAA